MIDLNNREEIKKLDPVDVLGTTENMLEQCAVAWKEVNELDLAPIENVKNIVFCGMGASIYGAMVLKAIMGRSMPYPIELVSDYYLPDYVNEDTLVVLTSYSGNTEEVLSCAEDAKAKKTKMVVITKGGALAEFAQDNNVPSYIFDSKLNPGDVPRLGNGYSIFGLIGILNKTRVIDIEEFEVTNAIERFKEKKDEIQQQAMDIVSLFENKIPIIFAAEHLSGNAQIIRNQFNETSKAFSGYFLIPDLNHHLMEGLQFPADAPLQFLVFDSPNYSDKIRKRVALTIDVVKQNKYPVVEFITSGQTEYDDFLEVLYYGCFLTLYLGLTYGQNPAINPWVDWFKNELK
jgi:glucose/mannose-6-phosphate isomerase